MMIVIVAAITAAAFVMSDSENMINDTEIPNDSPTAISDSATLDKNAVEPENNNPDYIIDEDGTKKYVISAIDSPDLGD